MLLERGLCVLFTKIGLYLSVFLILNCLTGGLSKPKSLTSVQGLFENCNTRLVTSPDFHQHGLSLVMCICEHARVCENITSLF